MKLPSAVCGVGFLVQGQKNSIAGDGTGNVDVERDSVDTDGEKNGLHDVNFDLGARCCVLLCCCVVVLEEKRTE